VGGSGVPSPVSVAAADVAMDEVKEEKRPIFKDPDFQVHGSPPPSVVNHKLENGMLVQYSLPPLSFYCVIISLSFCNLVFVMIFEVLTVVFNENLSPLECYAMLIGKQLTRHYGVTPQKMFHFLISVCFLTTYI
jgi:hypothetical protein